MKTVNNLDFIIEQPYEINKSGLSLIISLTNTLLLISPLFINIGLELSMVVLQKILKKSFSTTCLENKWSDLKVFDVFCILTSSVKLPF